MSSPLDMDCNMRLTNQGGFPAGPVPTTVDALGTRRQPGAALGGPTSGLRFRTLRRWLAPLAPWMPDLRYLSPKAGILARGGQAVRYLGRQAPTLPSKWGRKARQQNCMLCLPHDDDCTAPLHSNSILAAWGCFAFPGLKGD